MSAGYFIRLGVGVVAALILFVSGAQALLRVGAIITPGGDGTVGSITLASRLRAIVAPAASRGR